MSRHPTVSICVPSYNHGRYLPAALESALAQTYRDFEIVIVDDGSTDNSRQIAEQYAGRYPDLIRVCGHPQGQHRGISATGNLAFQLARGQYIAGLPSDDVWYPEKLGLQVAEFERYPQVGLVYGRARVIDAEGRATAALIGADISRDRDPAGLLIQGNVIPAMTVAFRRQCLEEVGAHDETLSYSDWELYVRILTRWAVRFLDRPLAMYRVHAENTSIGAQAPLVRVERLLEVMAAFYRHASTNGSVLNQPRTRATIDLQRAGLLFCGGRFREGLQKLVTGMTTDPSLVIDIPYLMRWLRHVRISLSLSRTLRRCWRSQRSDQHTPAA